MGWSLFLIFFAVALIGLPIALALVAAATIPLLLFTNTSLMVIPQRLFVAMDSFSLIEQIVLFLPNLAG